jgi:hypothetical protein
LKSKQLATAIEIPVICLSPLDVSLVESLNINSKEAVEVLNQNLSPPKINKIWAYE